jgi:hypothetical protein
MPSVSKRRAEGNGRAPGTHTLERERRRAGLALPHRDAGSAFRRDVVAPRLAGRDRAIG